MEIWLNEVCDSNDERKRDEIIVHRGHIQHGGLGRDCIGCQCSLFWRWLSIPAEVDWRETAMIKKKRML